SYFCNHRYLHSFPTRRSSDLIEENGFQLSEFLTQYYPFWIIYLVMTFMSILVFIAVIFFTSRMANNTEIVAIISSGASFHRFARSEEHTSELQSRENLVCRLL